MLEKKIYISKDISKIILNSIISGKKINYKKYKLEKERKKIQILKKEYVKIKKKNKKNTLNLKFEYFWDIVKKSYSASEIVFKQRSQSGKNKFKNILFYEFGQLLGYNPSLLTLLIFDKEIKLIYKFKNFFKKLKELNEIENLDADDKKLIIGSLLKGKVEIITPLCPDYEHVKISHNLYKYTFNKLNTGIGLIAKRLIKIIDKFQSIFVSEGIEIKYYVYYGDFEAFSKENCERLKIDEINFISNLKESRKNLKEKINKMNKVGLLVNSLTSKKKWLKLCEKNYKILVKKYNSDKFFKNEINEIANSRSLLYSNWYTKIEPKNYYKIVLHQGSEYSTMGDIFNSKFKNPIVFGLDHFKMKKFYSLNKPISVIYGKPNYE